MSMQHHNLTQGSPEWHAHRAKFWNASDAPVMMGCSPYMTRQQFLHECWERAQGIVQAEFDPALERIFAEGHRAEALARPLAEAIIGETFYPVVGTRGRLGASFDGLTMGEDVAFEHKLMNAELRALLKAGCTGAELPMSYQVQMQQQCMVAECDSVLFVASKWTQDGEPIESGPCTYFSNQELATAINRGWDQFEVDLAAYVPPEISATAPIGRTPETLPALRIEVTGMVTASNLDAFKAHALAVFGGIKTELVTDQDFADADKTVKWCSDVKAKLVAAKAHALSQTESIDALFRVIDEITGESDRVRLTLERIIKAEKEARRTAVVTSAQAELDAHVEALNERLRFPWVPRQLGGFGEAIKGLKSIESCKDKAATALAHAKIAASALADRLAANREALKQDGQDWGFLFADFPEVGAKPAEDFSAIAAKRINEHKARKEREEAAAKAVPPAAAPTQTQAVVVPFQQSTQRKAPTDTRPPITTTALNARFGHGFNVNTDALKSLGITPAEPPEGARSGTYWTEADFPAICTALAAHFNSLSEKAAA